MLESSQEEGLILLGKQQLIIQANVFGESSGQLLKLDFHEFWVVWVPPT